MEQLTEVAIPGRAIAQNLRYVIAFSIFAGVRNWLFPAAYTGSDHILVWVSLALNTVVTAAIVAIVVHTVRIKRMTCQEWGLQLKRTDWWLVGLICAAGVYFAVTAPDYSLVSISGALSIVLQFAAYELVLRAAGLSMSLRALDRRTATTLILVLAVNALIYGAAVYPSFSHIGITVGVLFVLSCCYYYLRSILLTMFLLSGYAVPDQLGAWVALFTILAYMALSAAVQRVESNGDAASLMRGQR